MGAAAGGISLDGIESLNLNSLVDGNVDVFQVFGYGDDSDLTEVNFNSGDVDNNDGDLAFVFSSVSSTATSFRPLSSSAATITNANGPQLNISGFNNGINSLGLFGVNTEELTFHGSAGDDAIVLNGGQITLTPVAGPPAFVTLGYGGQGSLIIAAAAGNDAISVTNPISAVHVDGGDPIQFSDTLTVDAGAAAVSYRAGPQSDEGAIQVGAASPISFDHIEGVIITGNGTNAVTAQATNADNDITVVGTGANSFTVSIDGGPAVQFNAVNSLVVDALAGDDDISVTTGPLAINSITINGGDPTAGSDTVVVTGTAAANNVTVDQLTMTVRASKGLDQSSCSPPSNI